MSSKIVVLLVLVSCLCMHMYACNAGRVLGFFIEETGSRNHDSVDEHVEKVLDKLSETTSMQSSTRGTSKSVEVKIPETVVIHQKADLSRKGGESAKPTSSGHGVTLSSSCQIEQEYQIELKWPSMLDNVPCVEIRTGIEEDSEEDHITDSEGSSNEAAIDEDVGVMDSANPHRKPPIHNENP